MFGILSIGLAAVGSALAVGAPLPPCFVDLPVFNEYGHRIDGAILSVSLQGVPESDLLHPITDKRRAFHVKIVGQRIYFEKSLVDFVPLRIEFRSRFRNGQRKPMAHSVIVPVFDCRQTFTLQQGESGMESEAVITRIEGRIVGCSVDRNWWVRVVPMFGGQDLGAQSIFDGYLDVDTGVYRVVAPLRGVRQIVIIGRDDKTIGAFGVNLTRGKRNEDMGDVDLRAACR